MSLLLDAALNGHEQGPVVSPGSLKLEELCEPGRKMEGENFIQLLGP
jgi:hypothetical protein